MADNKDPLKQLKDLSQLRKQLEDIQKRVDKEIHAGGGNLLTSPFLKGFLAGYLVARVRFVAVLGVIVGACTGIYAAQTYDVPNVERTFKDYLNAVKKRPS